MQQPQPQTIREYRPNPSALPFHESPAQIKVIMGPMGSGKSSAACMEWFFLCRESTVPVRSVVLRESYRQLRDSTLVTFKYWFEHLGMRYVKDDETAYVPIENFNGDIIEHPFLFRHARRPEGLSDLLSTEYGMIWLEEAVPVFEQATGVIGAGLPEAAFELAVGRQRQADMHRLLLMVTFNPPSKFHWCNKRFLKPTPAEILADNMIVIRQPAFENSQHLPPNYYNQLLRVLRPDLAKRFVEGIPVTVYPGKPVFGHLVYPQHLGRGLQPTKGVPLWLCYDFGLTPAVIICQTLPNARTLCLREICMQDSGIIRLADELKEVLKTYFPGFEIRAQWGDPAGKAKSPTDESTCFQILQSKLGVPVQPGPVDFQTRFESVADRLCTMIDGEPALVVDEDACPMLAEGLQGGYRYPRSDGGQMGRIPLKNEFSHGNEALQYGLGGEFGYLVKSGAKRYPGQTGDRPALPAVDPFSATHHKAHKSWLTR